MMKIRILVVLILSVIISNVVGAREIPVKIKPIHKITTSNLDLKEGDCLEFATSEDIYINSKTKIEKGQMVYADVTALEDNGFLVQPASLYIENFRTNDTHNNAIKLKGLIYKTGNDHHIFTDFFVFDVLRGGEVQIKPEKDEFTIYFEDNL